jgi:signal transduction histidine kinase
MMSAQEATMTAPGTWRPRRRVLPRRSVRLRLTALYGALFLLSGAVLLAITGGVGASVSSVSRANSATQGGTRPPPAEAAYLHAAVSHALIVGSAVALGIMTVVSLVLGWIVAGRVLRPLREMTAATQRISEENLHERLAMPGPGDELKDLADTIDGLLERLEGAFAAQRRFVANASHELRTPLSRIRIGVDLLRQTGDPKYEAELIRDIAELDLLVDEILLASRLDATKTLGARESVDLLALTAEECARYDGAALDGEPTTIDGDPRLLRRLLRNLLENAVRHGKPPVEVRLTRAGGNVALDVRDHGPGIPEADRERVFVPFQQLGGDAKGSGLGLALVRQIARLHGGDAVAMAADGANVLRVTLPVAAAST